MSEVDQIRFALANAHMTLSRCAVRGSINNDEYFHVRNIARPGETISSYQYERRVGGKGANQAIAIIKAGGAADFYGSVGGDGLWVKEAVGTFGLDPKGILVSEDVPTGRALIQISDSGENSIILFPGANFSRLTEESWTNSGIVLPHCTHLLLQNEIRMESTLHALNHSDDVITVYNPSPMPSSQEIREFPWGKVDWLIVNEGEADDLFKVLSGYGSLGKSPDEVLMLLSAQPALARTNIVCTLGKDGVSAFVHAFHGREKLEGGNMRGFIHVSAAELRGPVRDTTGAGDCFTGYFVKGLMEFGPGAKPGQGIEEEDVVDILKTCVQAAGICVERPGTIDSVPMMSEVRMRLHDCWPRCG